jgi:Asp-tRNA(Asn)/Glu-tRNA(Gln) amidotransferase C subunit
MASFLWKKVSDKEKKEIQKQAKKILDDFSKELSRAGKDAGESFIERESGEREEGSGKCDDNFSRKKMFENAPEKNDNFIIGEKGRW